MICRRPSGNETEDIAQPLQMIGTNSDHSFGCKINRRAGIVWDVAASGSKLGCPPAPTSPGAIVPPHSKLNAGHKEHDVSHVIAQGTLVRDSISVCTRRGVVMTGASAAI